MTSDEYSQYKDYLPGLTPECPEDFFRIAQIFSENVFELIIDEQTSQISVVYMMDDAIESFIVLENAVLTGNYIKELSGNTAGSMDILEDGYMLILHQYDDINGDNFFTIKFTDLHIDNHLYQYHHIGHFWMKNDEYLRQLDYRLWIIRDKYQFWQENACNDKETALIPYYEFGPLRHYTCIDWERDAGNPYTLSGIDCFINLAKECDDTAMLHILNLYRNHPTNRILSKILSLMLKSKKHIKISFKLQEKISEASKEYNHRTFGEKYDQFIDECRNKLTAAIEFSNYSMLLEEQPFSLYDEFEYSFHILTLKGHGPLLKTVIHSIELKGNTVKYLQQQFDTKFNVIISK